MTEEELPFLNLDAATSLYLPLEPIEARAHYRFAFRLANGDEEWLLARLCLVKPDAWSGRDEYCIILRPEKAEESRIFVAHNISLCTEEFSDTSYILSEDVQKFDWDLYAQSFHNDQYNPKIVRYSIVGESHKTTLLRTGVGGLGTVIGVVDRDNRSLQRLDKDRNRIRFRGRPPWGRIYPSEGEFNSYDLKFLRTEDKVFRRRIRYSQANPNSKLRYMLRWMELDENERDNIAFECKNGNWEALTRISTLVLQIRISHQNCNQTASYEWDFNSFWIHVYDNKDLSDDGVLSLWRFAITHIFEPLNLPRKGMKRSFSHLVVSNHLSGNAKTKITVSPISMHELMESNLALEAWAKENFSAENARILMDSFQIYSRVDAHKFYLSLDKSNLLDAPLKWFSINNKDCELVVGAAQYLLRDRGFYQGEIDGIWGIESVLAVKAFQRSQGLKVNGFLGPKTLPHLVTSIRLGSHGDAVRAAQLLVKLTERHMRKFEPRFLSEVDGIFEADFEEKVFLAQASLNRIEDRLREDGIVGLRTWCLLFGGEVIGHFK